MSEAHDGINQTADTMITYFFKLRKSFGLTWRTITTYRSTAMTNKCRIAEMDSILLIRSILRHRHPTCLYSASSTEHAKTNGIAHDPDKKSKQARLVRQILAGERSTFFFQTRNTTKQLTMTIETAIKTKKKIAAMLRCPDAFLLSPEDVFVTAVGEQFRCNAILVVSFVLNSTF